jgi:ABC-type glycerol-3-phosphate transport system permease component
MSASAAMASRSGAATGRRRPAIRPGRLVGRAGFFILLAIFVIASLFPFYWIVITSLKTTAEYNQGTTSLLPPSHITFSNYIDDFTQQDFIRPLLNSVGVSVVTTLLTVVIAALAGYALSRTSIRGKTGILGFILLAAFFPALAIVGPMFIAYKHLGLLNTLPGLVICYLILTLPLATWLLTNYFAQIPKELEEAAIVDGTSRVQALWKVIVPVAMPAMFTVAILSFILAWNDFTFAVSFISTSNNYTAPLAIYNLGQSQFQVFYGLIDAAVVIISLPIALLVIFAQKRIISGLTAGSFR